MAPDDSQRFDGTPAGGKPLSPDLIVAVPPGQVIGERYRIDAPLGSGGMGVVCRATHLGLGTSVAIKLIRPDLSADAEFVRRFLNEARRAAVLRSERIARVHDVGQLDSGTPFLVMELLEGVELGAYLKERGPLPIDDAVNIALQICEGLAEAHANGIVHRDIKPANTFLVRRADGRFAVKILDFGISKQVSDAPNTLTDSHQSLGSPWYMSPEQMLDASAVDGRSDIWSVGVVLFELITGRHPFDGANVAEVCAKVLTSPAPSLQSLRPELPAELEGIVERCLEKNIDDRFPDVAALGAALQRFALLQASDVADTSVEPTAFFERNSAEGSIAPVALFAPPSARRRRRAAHVLAGLGMSATVVLTVLAFGRPALRAAQDAVARIGPPETTRAPAAPVVITPTSLAPAPPSATPPTATATPPASTASSPAAADPSPSATTPAPAASEAPAAPNAASDASEASRAAPGVTSAASTPSSAPPSSAGAAPSRTAPARAHSHEGVYEPPLSPDEIRARKERYQRWLAEQGLKRIDEVDHGDDNPYQ